MRKFDSHATDSQNEPLYRHVLYCTMEAYIQALSFITRRSPFYVIFESFFERLTTYCDYIRVKVKSLKIRLIVTTAFRNIMSAGPSRRSLIDYG